jgi:tetratricopeptide (TPR) repeat protein
VLLVSGCDQPSEKDQADDEYRAAQTAIAGGDKRQAISRLDNAIELQPTFYAYFLRAQMHLETGDTNAALRDCKSGLEIDPENRDLKWLLVEAKKPTAARFKGVNARPPSASH